MDAKRFSSGIPEIINNAVPLIGAVATVLIVAYLVLRRGRRNRAAAAAEAACAFRTRVLAELEGLYPVTRLLDSGAFDKFKETVPGIRAAAAEFRDFVPPEKRGLFDEALNNYCDHCREITWQSCATFGVVPEMSKPDDIGPKEIFRQDVNALLSFAKRH